MFNRRWVMIAAFGLILLMVSGVASDRATWGAQRNGDGSFVSDVGPADSGALLSIQGPDEEYEEFENRPDRDPSWGIVRAISAPNDGDDVRVNDISQTGDFLGCNVQSETATASYRKNVYVVYNDMQQCDATNEPKRWSWIGFGRSTNGGKTFKSAPLKSNGKILQLLSDPSIAIDTTGKNKGTIYISVIARKLPYGGQNSLSGAPPEIMNTNAVAVSTDNGKTFKWHDLQPYSSGSSHWMDKTWITVDNSGGPRDGTLYVVGITVVTGAVTLYKSTDQGKTWSRPIAVNGKSDDSGGTDGGAFAGQGPRPVVGPDGELYITWLLGFLWNNGGYDGLGGQHGEQTIMWARSRDGGRNFKLGYVASFGASGRYEDPEACGYFPAYDGYIRAFGLPSMAIDTWGSSRKSSPNYNPARGTVYVVYGGRGRPPATDVVDVNIDSSDVYFSKLVPGSDRWTKPVRLNDDDTVTDQFYPEIVIARPGKLMAVWTDRRDDPANRFMGHWGTISKDGGKTWEPNFPISDTTWLSPNDDLSPRMQAGGVTPPRCYAGDYIGLYADASGTIMTSWNDVRDKLVATDGVDSRIFNDPNVYFQSLRPWGGE